MKILQRIMIVVNPKSGRGSGGRCYQKISKSLKKLSDENEIAVKIVFTQREGERNATKLAKRAVEEKYSLIVVIGGDGTYNEVANGVAGSGIPLLLIEAGSGNDFPKALGIPKDPRKAFELITQGKVVSVDLGKVNERVFVNVFGLGFDARVTRCAESLKQKLSFIPVKFLYLIALLRELLFKIEYLPLEIKISEPKTLLKRMSGRVTLLVVANGPSCGGVFKLAPQADLQDGLLDLCLIKKTSRQRIFRFILKGIAGSHIALPEVIKERGQLPRACSLTVSSLDGQDLPCQMDGEVLSPAKEYQISVLPGALNVIVPQTAIPVPVLSKKLKEQVVCQAL